MLIDKQQHIFERVNHNMIGSDIPSSVCFSVILRALSYKMTLYSGECRQSNQTGTRPTFTVKEKKLAKLTKCSDLIT